MRFSRTVLSLEGEFASLDDVGLLSLAELLAEHVVGAEPPEVVLDLSHTNYIGSQFIRLLLQIWNGLRRRGGLLVLCGVHDFCAEVLRAMQLDHLWPSCDTKQQALEYLQKTVRA